MKMQYLKLTWVERGKGIRMVTAKVIQGKGQKPKGVIYPKPGDPCTEPRFMLYQAGRLDELRLWAPSSSQRRLRRFLRDFVCQQGGLVWTTNYWTTPWH